MTAPMESGYVTSNGALLYFEVAGEGPPIALLHAGVADCRQWDGEFADLTQDHRVLRYDQRGFGKSLPVDRDFRALDDLATVLHELDSDAPVVLVGCSMGGTLALDFALSHPEKVRALVMVGSGPSGLQLDVPDHPMAEAAAAAYEAGDLDRLAELETQIWFDGMGRTADAVDPEKRSLAKEMNRLALEHDAQHVGKRLPDAEDPAFERLEELSVPVLVIVGEHDLPYLHAAADYLAERAPRVRVVRLADAAHLANMDHPDAFRAALRSFLAEITT